jgi:hypothetical protein
MMEKTTIWANRLGANKTLSPLSVGRGSALDCLIDGLPEDVTNVQFHAGRPNRAGVFSVVTATRLPDGRWAVYANGLHFPDAGSAKYHVTGRDGKGNNVWLGCGPLAVLPSVLNIAEEEAPIVPEDTYIRNPVTGLWHKLLVSVEGGALVPEIENEGVTR